MTLKSSNMTLKCFFFLCPPQLQHEKAELEQHLEQEQEFQVNKLMKKIKKMENETISKQLTLEQVDLWVDPTSLWAKVLVLNSHKLMLKYVDSFLS